MKISCSVAIIQFKWYLSCGRSFLSICWKGHQVYVQMMAGKLCSLNHKCVVISLMQSYISYIKRQDYINPVSKAMTKVFYYVNLQTNCSLNKIFRMWTLIQEANCSFTVLISNTCGLTIVATMQHETLGSHIHVKWLAPNEYIYIHMYIYIYISVVHVEK